MTRQEGQQDVPRTAAGKTLRQFACWEFHAFQIEAHNASCGRTLELILAIEAAAAGGQREAALDVPTETAIKDGLLELQRRYGRLSKVPGSELLRLHEAVAFLATPPAGADK